nr:hypothetical protein [uncultured Oscillibacter sp.]
MLNIKAKEVAPIVEQPADISEDWPEDVVEEPTLDLSEPSQKKATTMKIIVWVCLLNGIAWVWCSYILAWMGKEQIAESLSQVALTEIIGVVLVYAIKSAVENLSKNNSWPDKSSLLIHFIAVSLLIPRCLHISFIETHLLSVVFIS